MARDPHFGLSRKRTAIVLAAAAVLTALGVWNTLYGIRSPGGADPNDAEQVALGKRVYAAHCASCHGAGLEGEADWQMRKPDGKLPAPPHDESGHTWHHPDRHLFEVTKYGTAAIAPAGYKTDMIGFGDTLSDDEIWAAIAYIKSRWPDDVRARQQMINEQAERAN